MSSPAENTKNQLTSSQSASSSSEPTLKDIIKKLSRIGLEIPSTVSEQSLEKSKPALAEAAAVLPDAMVKKNKFVKIWFAKPNTQHPLGDGEQGLLNEYLLEQHRSSFPNDEITLISNFEDFSESTQKYLVDFCALNNIALLCLNAIINATKESDTLKDKKIQLRLLEIAKLEIIEESGCLAAASDIVRTLSSVIKLGMYLDVDLVRKPGGSDELYLPFGVRFKANFSLLPSLYNPEAGTMSFGVTKVCNNLFICDESVSNFFEIYREHIHNNYRTITKEMISNLHKQLGAFSDKNYKLACNYMKSNKNLSPLPKALEFRRAFQKISSPKEYETFLFDYISEVSGPGCMQAAIGDKWLREELIIKKMHPFAKLGQITPVLLARCLGIPDNEFKAEYDLSWLPDRTDVRAKWKAISILPEGKKIALRYQEFQKSLQFSNAACSSYASASSGSASASSSSVTSSSTMLNHYNMVTTQAVASASTSSNKGEKSKNTP